MMKIEQNDTNGSNVSIENNLTNVELLKYKGKTQMMKVRFSDDGGNTYDVWMTTEVIDRLGDML